MKRIHLRPRLSAAADMLCGLPLADIGCDHGKLCAHVLLSGKVPRAIGVDISEASLQKARLLCSACALEAHWTLKAGSGLMPLFEGEAEQLSFCGMGGELIAQLLDERPAIAKAVKRIVMQPMGGAEELRKYLYTHGYRILDERLVQDAGRIYQLIAASAGECAAWPKEFPADCFTFGIMLFQKKDPLLLPLLLAYRASHQRRLEKAQSKGRNPEALLAILANTDVLIKIAKGELPL